MTVRDARKQLFDLFGDIKGTDDANPIYDHLHDTLYWLHGLSGENMRARLGPDYGDHPDLPSDIDAATQLTALQLSEYEEKLQQLAQITPSHETGKGSCPYCSGPSRFVYHVGTCPRVKAIEYHPDGSVKRVEFHDPFGYDQPPVQKYPAGVAGGRVGHKV